MSGQAPLVRRVEHVAPAQGTTTTDSTVMGRAPVAGTVSRATFVPKGAVTGAATNNRTLALVNRGQNGAGAISVATITFNAGINGVAYDELDIPVTAVNATVAEGDILEWRSTANGTGLADPGGLVTIEYSRS